MATSRIPQLTETSVAPASRIRITLAAILAGVVALSIAAYFWIDSRYPALLKKEQAGKGIHLSGNLSFDALLPVTPQMSFLTRVGYTAIDWAWTNRIGMTFGVFFGAAMLTFLAFLPRRRFAGDFSNTALGALIGAPLGVCTNCVAPIGRGIIQAGASPATMLATMISSPTLNVVVLVMAFTLLPPPIAIARLVAPLVLLALVPMLVRGKNSANEELVSGAICSINVPIGLTWQESLLRLVRAYFANLGRLALATVPWMILAGLLGALVVELIPAQNLPAQVTVLGIVAVALLGTFAPVPIAFDVALGWILLSRGVPAPYVATLVCTLGAFSIYPFFIVGRSLSWRVALRVFAAVMSVGVLAGLATMLIHS